MVGNEDKVGFGEGVEVAEEVLGQAKTNVKKKASRYSADSHSQSRTITL